MKDGDLLKEQSIFAYKSAARLLLALGTILLVFGLAFWKVVSDERFAQSKKGREVRQELGAIGRLVNALPIGKLDRVDSATVFSIDIWKYHHGEQVRRLECDKGGALYWLFMPGEDTISIDLNTLLDRLRRGIHAVRHQGQVKETNLESLYFAAFVVRGDEKDYRLLADKFQKGDSPDSDVASWKKDFRKVDFRPNLPKQIWDFDAEHLAGLWLPLIDSLKAISRTYSGIYEPLEGALAETLSYNNLHQLSDSLSAREPPIGDLKLGAGVEFQGRDAFRSLGFLVFFSLLFTRWFLKRAQKFEEEYSERMRGRGSVHFPLSGVSSGVIHVLEYNTPRVRLSGIPRGRRWWVGLQAWCCSLLWSIPLVGFPFVASIMVPVKMDALVPQWHGFGPVVYEYVVPGLVLLLSLDIYLRILEPKWARKLHTCLDALRGKVGSGKGL
jgi:hypothetical protein